MTKRIDITGFVYIILMILIFTCGTAFSQEFLSSDNFQLDADKKTVQNSIDTLLLNKFN